MPRLSHEHIRFERDAAGCIQTVRFCRHTQGRLGQLPEIAYEVMRAWSLTDGTVLVLEFKVDKRVPLDVRGNLALHRYENVAGPGDAAYAYAAIPGQGLMILMPDRRIPWFKALEWTPDGLTPEGFDRIRVAEQRGEGEPCFFLTPKTPT